MKKIIQGFLIGTCLLGLSACGNEISKNKPPKTESTIKNSTELTGENIESKETVKDTKADDSLWNNDKSLELKTFMNHWETVMGQKYQEYEQGENVAYYDMQLPKDIFEKNRFKFFEVDNEEVLLEWYTSGKEAQNTYQLLTVYSDADTQPDMEKHVYFFTLYNGEPRVLSGSLLKSSDTEQPVHFTETQNENLKNGFNDIFKNGKTKNTVDNRLEQSSLSSNDMPTFDVLSEHDLSLLDWKPYSSKPPKNDVLSEELTIIAKDKDYNLLYNRVSPSEFTWFVNTNLDTPGFDILFITLVSDKESRDTLMLTAIKDGPDSYSVAENNVNVFMKSAEFQDCLKGFYKSEKALSRVRGLTLKACWADYSIGQPIS